jgi:hypothetical protein
LESRGKQAAETGKKRGGKKGRGEQKEKGKGNQTWDYFLRYRGEGKSKTEEGREEPPLHLHQRLHRSSQPPQQHRHPATINAANASRTREGEEKQNRNRG